MARRSHRSATLDFTQARRSRPRSPVRGRPVVSGGTQPVSSRVIPPHHDRTHSHRASSSVREGPTIGVVLLAAALGPAGVCAPRFAERRHAGSADRSCQEQETPGWMFPLPHDAGRICLPANPARRHVLASNRRQCSYCWLCPSPPRSPSGTNSRPVGFTNPIATGVIVPVVSSTVPTKLATPESFGVSV